MSAICVLDSDNSKEKKNKAQYHCLAWREKPRALDF